MAATNKEENCAFITTWRGEHIGEIKTAWDKARIRAKVQQLLVHDLQTLEMIRVGIPEKHAMRISGHKSRSMFDRYDITDERDIQIAGQKLARYLEGKAEVVTREVTTAENGPSGRSKEVQ